MECCVVFVSVCRSGAGRSSRLQHWHSLLLTPLTSPNSELSALQYCVCVCVCVLHHALALE